MHIGRAAGLIVREASARDNESLIGLELACPIVVGDVEETYDRRPDFFAAHRVQAEHRIVLAELEGRLAGVMAGVIQAPVIQGRAHRLAYIHRARVHPDFQGRRVAWAMANDLFAWAGRRGAEGPYYLIAPGNAPSNEFVQRGGGRWPVEITLREIETAHARAGHAAGIPEERLDEFVHLVNRTHAGDDFFEPLTAASMASRLRRDARYAIASLRGIYEGGALVAAGGLWDRGATAERIQRDRTTGVTVRSRAAAVVDWGFLSGREDAFAELLRRLVAEARALGRSGLVICEPRPGAVPDAGLPGSRTAVSLYTPALAPPAAGAIRGLQLDLLCV